MRLFWERGYDSTSIDDLVHAIGTNRPAIYRQFGGKEGLFLKTIEKYEQCSTGFFWASLQEGSLITCIESIFSGFVNLVSNRKTTAGWLCFDTAIACSTQSECVRAMLIERRSVYQVAMLSRFEHALHQGHLKSESDPGILSKYLSTVLAGISLQARAGASKSDLIATSAVAIAPFRLV